MIVGVEIESQPALNDFLEFVNKRSTALELDRFRGVAMKDWYVRDAYELYDGKRVILFVARWAFSNPVWWYGFVSLCITWYFLGVSWWLLPSLFLLGTRFFWSKYFFMAALWAGLKKHKVLGRYGWLSNEELFHRYEGAVSVTK